MSGLRCPYTQIACTCTEEGTGYNNLYEDDVSHLGVKFRSYDRKKVFGWLGDNVVSFACLIVGHTKYRVHD